MSSRALRHAEQNQRIAADPALSVFVTANAGAGKTKVLVDRIARLLLQGSKPAAFLCITYTKAAAAEMQRRLFERLGGWCIADDARLAADLDALGAKAADLGAARALFAQALETPGGLKIQTIHAFCERLLARFPLEADVPPGFDVADEARAAALMARARAEAALAVDAPAEAFRRFAGRLSGESLEAFMDRLALRRADFHRFVEQRQGPIFAEAAVMNRHGAGQDAEVLCAAILADLDWNGLAGAAEALLASSANNQRSGQRIRTALDARKAGAKARAVLECVLRIVLKEGGEPYDAPVTATFAAQQPWAARTLEALSVKAPAIRERLNAIDRADDAAAALTLALKLDQAYADTKSRAGVLDFDDLIERAGALLGKTEAAPWVLYKLDGGLDHILIDEGQDTSPAQWNLIAPLQDEFFAGKGARAQVRTVFAVGDPKQSIYAFQGADPRRFLAESRAIEKRSRRANLAFKSPDLLTSFRSAPEILQAVDAVFADKALMDAAAGHDIVEHLAARENEHGAVEVWPVARRPEAQPARPWDAPMDTEVGVSAQALLARALAQRVREMIEAREAVWARGVQRPMQAGDVLALVRTRGPLFRELIKAFKRAGLPVAGADRMVLRDELAVEDCLALMRVALDPADDLSLACVLKGPWLNLDNDDADLFPLAYGRKSETLYARLLASADAKYAPARAFFAALSARSGADAFAFLSWALETPHGGGPTGWELVLSRLGGEARDPLEELLQRALKQSAHTAATLQRFLSDIETDSGQVKREMEGEAGAVRVMTVHGAKGLEAPLVVLPDTTSPVEDAPESGLLFDDEEGPFVSFRADGDDSKTAAVRAAHRERMESEHWRLLYVAMTRARDRLIVCGAQYRNTGAGEAPTSWRAAAERGLRRLGAAACETPFGEGLRWGAPSHAAESAPATEHAPTLPAWTRTFAPGAGARALAAPSRLHRVDPALFSPMGDGQRRFRRGRLIHGLLERLPELESGRRGEVARAWLRRQGASEEEQSAFADEALSVLASFPLLFGAKSRAEAPIVGAVAGRAVSGIVDRLAVDDETVMVLDFKTDRPAPKDAALAPQPYVLQLALYHAVLRQIFPNKAVQCALLWTEAPLMMALPEAQLEAALNDFLRLNP